MSNFFYKRTSLLNLSPLLSLPLFPHWLRKIYLWLKHQQHGVCVCVFYQKAWSGVPIPDSIKAPVERQKLEFPLIEFPKNSPLFFARYYHVTSQAKFLYFF